MKTTTQDLIKIPSQIFEQGELGDEYFEFPLQLRAYESCISIYQEERNINLLPDAIQPFIKTLRNFKKECYDK